MSRSVKVYIGALYAVLIVVLGTALATGHDLDQHLWQWLIFSALLGTTEALSLFFHSEDARYSLSASEVVLLPMLVALSFPQALLGAVVANTLGRLPRWRVAPFKETFNLAQYGCSTAAGLGVWAWLHHPDAGFSVYNASIAVLSVIVVALLSHVFVAGAIALSGEGRFRDLSLAIARAFLLNLAGDLTLGVLFAASYHSAEWTLLLFVFPLAALFLGYRAVIRQEKERQRVEHLHAATRALVATPDLAEGVTGFLKAVADMMSANDVRAIVEVQGSYLFSHISAGEVLSALRPLKDEPMNRLVKKVAVRSETRIVLEDETGEAKELATDLGLRSFVAVPVGASGDATGLLLAGDRIGAGEFDQANARLLEALADELLVRLESHRLFSEVMEERERFGRIFSGSKEGICLLDDEGVIRAWNPALENMTGYRSDDLMGRVWSEVVVIRDRSEVRLHGDELVGAEPDEELELVTRSGPSRWVTTMSGPVGESEGGGWVVLVRDVSAEHEIEAAKSDFLSTISHELRTPLTTIKGSLQVLSRGRDNLPTDLADQMIGVTTRGAERLERLVMNLLAVSQIEAGTMPMFPDEVGLEQLVRERADSMLKDHEHYVIDGSSHDLIVRVDRERMSQVVEHLLENAIKFGGKEGTITIALERENGYAHMSVSDEGPGISSADQERIFERFVRLGDVLTRETQGAGVGLFIAARSVQAMGGRIWVDGEGGEGSTFHVTVPLAHPVAVEDRDSA
ncbi:MAG: hypothetical protein QOG04_86 [Actinomycetota bacterium]|jgi:PAS domain S-box-containing protein|nr:hypothetical protein [Actinomycetota bacterium]